MPPTLMLKDPNQGATTVKHQDVTEISVAYWKNSENKLKNLKIILETNTVTPKTLTQIATLTIITKTTTTIKTVTELKRRLKVFFHPVRRVAKRTTPQRDVMLEPMQQTGHFLERANRQDRVDIINRTQRTVWFVVFWPQPNIFTRNATFSLRNCEWQTGDHQRKIPPFPGAAWQQPLETSVES